MVLFAILGNLLRALFFPFHWLRRRRVSPRDGYVELILDGRVVDLPPRRPRFAWLRGSAPPVLALSRLQELSRLLAADPRAKGLLVRFRSLAAGPAVLTSLRDRLCELRAAGKDVIAYLPQGADTASLYVASAAREIIVGPETMVAPLGYAVEGRYLRDALARLGVEPEVFAKGMYKSAGEALVRDTMSEPQREQLGALLESRHDALVAALSQGRRVTREVAAGWIDSAPHSARHAIELGIIDAALYDDELDQLLAPEPSTARLVSAERYLRARRPFRFRPLRRRPILAVIEVHGAIVSRAESRLLPLASEERIVAAVRAARESSAVRGVVLHIDSRGGSAIASDRIYHEVTRLAAVKPVIAYLGDVAASGGYYVASAAHAIVAQPQTVTGSIGVVSTRLVFGPLLERLGVNTSVVKRGARADLFSSARHLEADERAAVERELESFYQTFLRVVAKGRGRTIEEIEPLAGGRIYSGAHAHTAGLLDHLGGFDRALFQLRDLIGAEAKRFEPRVLAAPHTRHRKLLLPQLAELAGALGLTALTEQLALELEGDRVLAYWPD